MSLHDAARRYCITRAREWGDRYAALGARGGDKVTRRDGSWDYTDAARDIYPRYNALDAILRAVEALPPDATRDALAACAAADAPHAHRLAQAAVADEQRRFTAFIAKAKSARRLPFRRTLADDEHELWYTAFALRWGEWYGGYADDAGEPSVTLHTNAMTPTAYKRLRAAIGAPRVLELREHGAGYELDLALASFAYNGAEGYWSTEDLSWMVYASHESSITFGGAPLIAAMRAALPAFDRWIYRGWDLAAYA